MIRYRLSCEKGHEFEGWFQSSEAFDKQAKRKLVQCAVCASTKVSKALMAPSVVTSEKKRSRRRGPAEMTTGGPPPSPASPPAPSAPEPQLVASAEHRAALAQLKKLRDEVLAKSEYVGPRFAEEARRIHSQEAGPRGIHGEASPAEVKSLVEDGIEVYPVPVLPDDHN